MTARSIDEKLIWQTFFYWIQGYWLSTQEYVAQSNKVDPTSWLSLAQLYKRLADIERQETRASNSNLEMTDDMKKEFLLQESRLINME